ncbi:MAG: phosphopantetheine-binding protein, partial [Myxococcota bacterium]|nr:phosphopantetheine-binding protein [Myxococcota bacterium]
MATNALFENDHCDVSLCTDNGQVSRDTMVAFGMEPSSGTAFVAPPQPVAPPPVAPVATPASVAPYPPMAAAPIPVPVAPVAAAPVAPAPVAPAPAAPAPAATAAAPVAAAPGTDLTALLLTVVADKTGYPADMLDLGMDLEGDLGVDSIKRVEILSAMQDQAPDLPEVDPGEMAQLRTLGQIVDKLGGAAAAAAPAATAAAPTGPAAAIGSIDLKGLLLEVVAEKTGYPADMLDLGMDLEGDLGVDSIKRVEILSAMQDKAPDLPEVDPGEMAKLRTLGQIVDKLGEGDAVPFVDGSTDHASASVGPVAMPDNLGRFTLSAVPAPATGLSRAGIVGADPLYILDGGSSLAAPLSEALVVRGVRAVAAEALPEGATAAVFLGGLAPLADIDAACAVNHAAFAAAKALGTTATAFVTVQDTGGCFGLSDTLDPVRAWSAGLAALARTAAIEWPTAAVKAIDIERAGRDAASLAAALADELVSGGAALEVGLTADGGRFTLADTREPPTPTAPTLDPGDVVVVSGGARGVTAATVVGLARDTGARFVLLGRTALAAEPPAARGAETDADLKRALMLAARAAGETPNPRALGREVKAILAGREIRATLAAVEAAGGTARYVSVDVTDR